MSAQRSPRNSRRWIWPTVLAVLAVLALLANCRAVSPSSTGGKTIAEVAPVQSPAQSGLFNINWQYTPHVVGGTMALLVAAFVMWRALRAMRCIALAAISRLRNGKNGNMVQGSSGRYVRQGPPNKG